MNYLFLNTNFALKRQGKCLKDDVIMFTAHLSVTIKSLTRYKQKVVLAAMCSVNFWHQQDSKSLFKRSIGHVTS